MTPPTATSEAPPAATAVQARPKAGSTPKASSPQPPASGLAPPSPRAWDTQTGNRKRAAAATARADAAAGAEARAAEAAEAARPAREGADPLGLWATITRGQWEAMDQVDRHLITLVDRPLSAPKAVRAWLVDLDHVAQVASVEPTEALMRLRRMQSDGLLGVMVSNRSCREWRGEIMVAIARPGDDDHLCIAAVRGEPSRLGTAGTWDDARPLPIPRGQGIALKDLGGTYEPDYGGGAIGGAA